MSTPGIKEEVLALLRKAETTWDGYADPSALADEIVSLVETFKTRPPIARPPAQDQPPSEEFEDAFRDGHGTVSADCELCGRTLFGAGLEHSGDEGEWEEALEGAQKNPAKWAFKADDDMVSLATVGGMQAVLGCPCNGLRRYENFVWNERTKIAAYYKARLELARKTMTGIENAAEVSELAAKS